MKPRRRHSLQFKAKIALEALKGNKTMAELAREHQLDPKMIREWKNRFMEGGLSAFETAVATKQREDHEAKLYEKIGRLEFELDWLKKKLPSSTEALRQLIEIHHPKLSIRRQCQLLGLGRSSYFYQPVKESETNLKLMRLMDQQFFETPFYGSRKMTAWLKSKGYPVNRKRVLRLMRLMSLAAVYPNPKGPKNGHQHRIYPYLLRNMEIVAKDQVWASDITYIPMDQGFMYLVAVIDWYSRYVISWEISNSLSEAFCLDALEKALSKGRPLIFNTDKGSQFTSQDFTGYLNKAGVWISMTGHGKWLDNIIVERLWRTVKYEDVYLKDYSNGRDLYRGLDQYFRFYNDNRPHQSLGYQTPKEIYETTVAPDQGVGQT